MILSRTIAIVVAVLVLAALAPGLAADEAAPKAMTNEDVVGLAKLGLGDDVVIAKIQAATAVDFKTEVEDLQKLQQEGITASVITAMVKRQAGLPASETAVAAPVVAGAAGLQTSEAGAVTLVTKDKSDIGLGSVAGTISSTYAFVTVLIHSNFEGLKAQSRTSDRRPSLVVKSAKSPAGRMYFVKAEADKGDNVRSVKMGNMGAFGAKNLNAPDKSNRIECDMLQEGADTWRLTPKKDLKPGEYGLWYAGGSGGGSSGGGEMYDFGID